MEELREALRLRPDYPEAHYNLGLLLSGLKRYDEAEKEYREALRLRPDYPAAHNNLGNLLSDLKRYEDAEREYREALRLRPDYPAAHNNLGNLLKELKRYDEAEKEYREALRLRPDFMLAYNNLFVLLIERKSYEKAREEYVESLKAVRPYPLFQQAWKGFFLFIRALPQITLFVVGIGLIIYALIYLYNTAVFLATIAMGIFCIALCTRLYDLATIRLFERGPEATFSKSEPSKGTSKEE